MKTVILFLAALLPVLAWAGQLPARPYVSVHAEGEVRVAPDMYTLNLSIERTDKAASAAKKAVDDVSDQVLALARKAGIKDADITASQVVIAPDYKYENGQQIYQGTKVSRAIRLVLRDISKYPQLVDDLARTGLTRMQGVQPGRSDADALTRKALARAVSKAREDAAALATAADAHLGAVYSIQESGGRPVPRVMMAASARNGNSAEMLPGEITIQASVDMVYLITAP
jgi:uncharacterized protein YggE